MPKKNQRSVTIRKDAYEKLQKAAEIQGKSVAALVTDYANQIEVPAQDG